MSGLFRPDLWTKRFGAEGGKKRERSDYCKEPRAVWYVKCAEKQRFRERPQRKNTMYLLPSLLLSAMLSAYPASQQIYDPPTPVPTRPFPGIKPVEIGQEVDQIRSNIRKGRDRGQLSRKQAKDLRREASELDSLASRYGRDGMSDSEQAELRNRAEVLRAITSAKRSGAIE